MRTRALNWFHRLLQRRTSSSSERALILMYHRVAEVPSDPWGLCVSPSHFAEHLEILRENGTCIPLSELVQGLHDGKLPSDAIVLTFDDGYADNLYTAKPLLERFDVPATLFLTTGYLESQREFWWDDLERLLLQPGPLPEQFQLTIEGKVHEWSLGADASYSAEACRQHRSWRAWDKVPSKRHAAYLSLWETLYTLPDEARQHVLLDLRGLTGDPEMSRSTHHTLSAEEVISLADGDLIEVGGHTITHPPLGVHPPGVQRTEIEESKHQLEQLLSRPVTSFSYPHGHYSPETVSLARRAGFSSACSTTAVPVEASADRFQLPRVQVLDWDGDTFEWQLSDWLSQDGQN